MSTWRLGAAVPSRAVWSGAALPGPSGATDGSSVHMRDQHKGRERKGRFYLGNEFRLQLPLLMN